MRLLVILCGLFLFTASALQAEQAVGNDISHAEVIVQGMSDKLNRGIVNILTGWGEIPRQMIVSGKDKGWWAVWPIGIPSGAIMTAVRTGTGVFETALFFVPIDDSYGPILNPAFVWQKAD
jgi:putative exosortase-associated protein (TIGR04073 family)